MVRKKKMRKGKMYKRKNKPRIKKKSKKGGARGVMVIVVGNRHGDTSSNPGRV